QALAGNQQSRRKRENEIAALREKISRYRNQMLDVKTNEQYRALLHEIEFHETEIRKLEDEILAEMIASESLEKSLRESEQTLAEERARAQQEITAAEKQQQEEGGKLSDVQARRETAQQRLTADVYARYQRIATLRKGLAVATASDGTCQACYVLLRPQAYNEIKTNQQILVCESCNRILYYVPPPPSA
ncbi:MAG: C4-type zinc ribbon domain-containing protein, partial [Acidobacteriota bacterium]